MAVMNRLMRLSYWERVQSVLPEEFQPLLPPKPEVAALPSPEAADDDGADAEGLWAAKMLKQVRSKAAAEELDAWVVENDLNAVLGSPLAVVRALARCLLTAGAKSYTHMVIALERYYGPLKTRVDALGTQASLLLCSSSVATWPCCTARRLGCRHSGVVRSSARQAEQLIMVSPCWRAGRGCASGGSQQGVAPRPAARCHGGGSPDDPAAGVG